jgi:hypothetical protein
MNYEILIIICGVIAEIFAIYFYVVLKRKHDVITGVETSSVTALRKGLAEIKGKVVAGESALNSPLSNLPCVYYRFKVEQERSSGKSSNWQTIIDDRQFVEFGIQDPTGTAYVNLKGAELKFQTDWKGSSGIFNRAPEDIEKVLNGYDTTSKSFIFQKNLRYKETVLEPGDEVYCLGEVVEFKGYNPVFRKNKLPFIVSDKSEESIISELKLYFRLCFFLLIAIPLGIVIYLFIRSGIILL